MLLAYIKLDISYLKRKMPKKVLFVNTTNPASIIPEMLASTGCEVTRSFNGADGLCRLEEQRYDLVILMESPDSLDWTVCAGIRKKTPAPLIVISPGATAENCVQAIEAGADFFMRKPFGPMELIARVNALFQRAPSSQTAELISR